MGFKKDFMLKNYQSINNLKVTEELLSFVNDDLLKDTDISPKKFWEGFDKAVHELAPKNRELLEIINTHQGTKNVHSLDYVHKFPSRNRNLTAKDEIYLLWRCIKIAEARDEYYSTRRKSMIREIK